MLGSELFPKKTTDAQIGGFTYIKRMYYNIAGYKILDNPKLAPLKLEPYLALIASRNLLAIKAYPLGLGCTPSNEKAPPVTYVDDTVTKLAEIPVAATCFKIVFASTNARPFVFANDNIIAL